VAFFVRNRWRFLPEWALLNKKYNTKTWAAIQKEASRMKIKRETRSNKGGRPKKKPKQYLGKKQLAALLEKGYDIHTIAQKLRAEPAIVRKYIHKYGL